MKRKKILIIILVVLVSLPLVYSGVTGEDNPGNALMKVAVFSDTGGEIETKALSEIAVKEVSDMFHKCGRFYPADRFETATVEVQLPAGASEEKYKKAAIFLKCDLMVLIAVRRDLDKVFSAMKVVPLTGDHASLAREIQFKSNVPMSVPLKLAREIAYMHEKIPIRAKITSSDKGISLIIAGQWNGIQVGEFTLNDSSVISVTGTARFTSTTAVPENAARDGSLVINHFPAVTGHINDIEQRMKRSIERRYALQPAYGTVEDRFITAMLLYNLTVGALFPGYGTYLSVNSITKEENPSYGGIILTVGLVFTHLTLTESLTGYETNFFPWIKDSDKTETMQRFHIFLWASLPFTLTASFLDQLAHSLAALEKTPPFLMNGDEAAAVLSLFIPGGGLFYKGHRLMGWGYYFSEMFLAGYSAYYWGSGTTYIYTSAAFGLLKIIEITHAYFTDFGYDFYRREMDRPVSSYSITAGIEPANGRPVYRLGMALMF